MSDVVLIERHVRTVLFTINRPAARNAINLEVATVLGDAIEAADRDPDVWAIVLTGAGDLAFCAGADLKDVATGRPITPTSGPGAAWGFAGVASHAVRTPLIAAVNGFALGGGTEIVLACDLAVAASTARLGLPEVTRGLVAAAGGAFRLPAQLPHKVAMELLLTGEPITANRALELGLANRVVSPSEVVPAALELATSVTRNGPLAVQASKAVALGIDDASVPDDSSAWARSRREADAVRASDDAREGATAFVERRAPRWSGR